MGSRGPWATALVLGGLLVWAAAQEAGKEGPAPGQCHPDCTKYGNCGEDGECRCPFGRMGEACEIDVLSPCRIAPDKPAYCSFSATKSCECMRRCKKFFCLKDSSGAEICQWEGAHMRPDRGCYEREGVEPDKQYSVVPEEDEAGVKFMSGYLEGAAEVNRSIALKDGRELETVPASKCPSGCNGNGYCMKWFKDPNAQPFCACYRGFKGTACEVDENWCYNKCNDRGTCIDQFCHCKPPYFSIGCSRSKVYPANHSLPSPVNFKIYMYELNTHLAYDNVPFVGAQGHDPIYSAYTYFLDDFLLSSVRTEDPSEANLFFIPSFTYGYSGNVGVGMEHLNLVLDYVKTRWPYWNKTQGRDHFFWAPADRGGCYHTGLATQPIRLVHFGYYHPNTPWNIPNKEYGCYNPLKDVMTVPVDLRFPEWLANTQKLSVDELVAQKKSLFFFAGGVRKGDIEYSGGTRQALQDLTAGWNDPDFTYKEGGFPDYEERLRTSKFCLAPYGHGWGIRLAQAVIAGCVPVVIQEHVYQAFEDILPYELFSLRLNNEDLPRLPEILRSVTPEQYKKLLENMLIYNTAFMWPTAPGGKAFDYTIAMLRRRYLNFKSLYYY